MKRLRQWFIKEGLIKPSNVKETRELFSFPVKLVVQKKNPIWMNRHLERVS